jgi:hypothetical protein
LKEENEKNSSKIKELEIEKQKLYEELNSLYKDKNKSSDEKQQISELQASLKAAQG